MECPVCRLVNPGTAQRCDCGYDFEEQEVRESYLIADLREQIPDMAEHIRDLGRRDIQMGALCLVCGLLVTVLTAIAGRGFVVIAAGAVLVGLLWLARGYDRVSTGQDRRFWGGPPS